MTSAVENKSRVNWVDFAKGITIILVVQMHVTVGIQSSLNETASFMNPFMDFFRAFRMPLFFLVAGLFLHRSINKPWGEYIDKKVIHFAYFYFLWIAITFVIKYPLTDPSSAHGFTIDRLLWSAIEPFGTLWFIYMLAVFYVVTRLLNPLPMPVVMAIGLALFIWQPNPEIGFLPDGHSSLIKEFCWRYIFFLTGVYGYKSFFKLAEKASEKPVIALGAFAAFIVMNIIILSYNFESNHIMSLINSYAGTLTVIGFCAVLARYRIGSFLTFIGKHSLFIYISFFVPNAFLRTIMIKLNIDPEINIFILLIWFVSVVTPIIVYLIIKKTPLSFVYIRPEMFKLRYDKQVKSRIDAIVKTNS